MLEILQVRDSEVQFFAIGKLQSFARVEVEKFMSEFSLTCATSKGMLGFDLEPKSVLEEEQEQKLKYSGVALASLQYEGSDSAMSMRVHDGKPSQVHTVRRKRFLRAIMASIIAPIEHQKDAKIDKKITNEVETYHTE
ncbi:Uncharacterized protein Fot_08746 [Forsythia ovata]|uniref:Uncharacterized protein n=1 Tax=Forsythia ovata TaxID=205694 RepID=A0ABD1WZH0_9LAMI